MFAFVDPWHAMLPREGGHVVAVFGGGGKTSLLEAMTAALVAEGVPVAVTTTTRTEPLGWPGLRRVALADLAAGEPEARAAAASGPIFVAADGDGPGKWLGPSPAEVDALGEVLPEHVVLCEADGSGGYPVKLHRDDEPVWPGRTSLAVGVVGLSCIGRPPAEVLHRLDRLDASWLALTPDAPWDWDPLLRLLARPHGYLGRVPEGVPILLALLQMDECDDAIGLFDFTGRVMTELDVPLVVMGDTSGPEPRLRAACREDGEADDGADA